MKKELTVLRHILRIITPGEISDLTKTSNGRKQIPLTDILKVYFDGRPLDEAWTRPRNQEVSPKVLPFKAPESSALPKETKKTSASFVHTIGKRVVNYLNNFISEEQENAGSLFKAQKYKRWNDKKINENTEFVLLEKFKYKDTDKKIKSHNIYNRYEKTSQVDASDVKSDLSKSDTLGNLINKKSA